MTLLRFALDHLPHLYILGMFLSLVRSSVQRRRYPIAVPGREEPVDLTYTLRIAGALTWPAAVAFDLLVRLIGFRSLLAVAYDVLDKRGIVLQWALDELPRHAHQVALHGAVQDRYHVCSSHSLACSGLNPCPFCFNLLHQHVFRRTLAIADVDPESSKRVLNILSEVMRTFHEEIDADPVTSERSLDLTRVFIATGEVGSSTRVALVPKIPKMGT